MSSLARVKRLLVGNPIPTDLAMHERLSPATGLAVFASDALSSVAYATEEILLILVLAGGAALYLSVPIAVAIAALIVIVVSSYRQTIRAYPQGGGSYIVTRQNLGRYPSLVAGAALQVDYVLTVAVSVAAGIAAITSAIPPLYPHRVALCAFGVAGIAVANLRGVREAGRLFAVPTYLFLAGYAVLLGWGGVQWLRSGGTAPDPSHVPAPVAGLSVFLVLRAFASGCAALTGIEAVSNGVQAFRKPEPRNAAITLMIMAVILGFFFLGTSYLAHVYLVVPGAGQTVVSQLGRAIFGSGLLYYLMQIATAAIGIGVDRLPVGDDHDRQQEDDDAGDRQGVAERRGARDAQDEQDFLGRVGHRRQRVRGEDRQGDGNPQALLAEPLGLERGPEEPPLPAHLT